MANDELKDAAQKELMRRKAKAELDRRRGPLNVSAPAQQPASGWSMDDIISFKRTSPGEAFNKLDDTVRMFANGATFGFGDKAAAGVDAGLGQGDYASNLAENRAMTDQARQDSGATGMLAEIGGSVLPASKLAQLGVTATKIPMLGKYLGMTADGAALGALNAAGNDQDVSQGAMFGGAGGAVGQVAANVAPKIAGMFNKNPAMPTVDDLALQSKAAYQQAENAGVTIKPDAVERLRQGVYDDYADFGYHPELQPGAKVAYGELDRLSKGGNVDLKGLEGLRKIAGGGFSPMNPSNNALLGKTTGKIDDFLENLGPNDVLAGDPVAASSSLKEARRLWGQKSKLSRVEDLLDKAGLQAGSTGSGGNIENASRQQLKRLLTNPKLTRGMTPDEIKATKDAVLGTKPQNALRLLGKLSPQGNGLMMAIQAFGAGATGGMTLPLAAAGYGAKAASEAMTRKNADLLKAIIAGGGTKSAVTPKANATQKMLEGNKELIARLLMSGAVLNAPQQVTLLRAGSKVNR